MYVRGVAAAAMIALLGGCQPGAVQGVASAPSTTVITVPSAGAPAAVQHAAASPVVRLPSMRLQIGVTVPNASDTPIIYRWSGVEYRDSGAFAAAIDGDLAAALAKITPASTTIGSLRMIVPDRALLNPSNMANPDGTATAVATIKRVSKAIDAARPAALRQSGLFRPIATETGAIAIPAPGEADFLLWFENGNWHLRYRHGDPMAVSDTRDMAVWASQVANMARMAQHAGDQPGYSLVTHWPTAGAVGGVWFTFHGLDYYATDSLIPAMMTEMVRAAERVHPVGKRLGGRIKIVLATPREGPAYNVVPGQTVPVHLTAQVAGRAFNLAVVLGRVEAIRRSQLFDDVVIQHADVEDVPIESWDHVLWEPISRPLTWRFRSAAKGNDAWSFVSPGSNVDMQTWVEALRDQMHQPGVPSPPLKHNRDDRVETDRGRSAG